MNAGRIAQSHEKKIMMSAKGNRRDEKYHEHYSMSSLSSIMHGTPRHTNHDSILNDSMTTPPSRKSSIHYQPGEHRNTQHEREGSIFNYQQSPLPGDFTEKRIIGSVRASSSRLDNSFVSGSEDFKMSLLTSKLADKEKRIEEYRE